MRSPQRRQPVGGRGLMLTVTFAALALTAAACGSSSKAKTSSATTTAPAATTPTSTASSGSAPAVASASTAKGAVLVDSRGMTLYTFDPENSGTIACTTGCTSVWPPLVAPSGGAPTAGSGVTVTIATIARPDGTTQVTAGGHPLYNYSGDKAAGDTNGDGIAGKWHVARPTAASGAGTAPGATTAPPTTAYKY